MKMGRYVLAAVLTFSATAALAQQTTMPKTGQATYGSAGCGLGSLVFGDQAGMVQILAATTNGIGGQTFAITSGTSNCGQAAVGTKGAQLFIEANKEALAKDAARGSGETITTLSHLAGCKDAKAVATKLQQQYTAVFAAGSEDEVVVQKVLSTLKSDAALACHELS
jgi:hypothetical protein